MAEIHSGETGCTTCTTSEWVGRAYRNKATGPSSTSLEGAVSGCAVLKQAVSATLGALLTVWMIGAGSKDINRTSLRI